MSRALPALLIAATALSLTACSKSDGNGSVAIDMNSEADAGNVSISVPGFDAKVKVPTGLMTHGDFDIDGVKLYPGAMVTTFNLNVDGKSKEDKDSDNTVVKMTFAAPADVPTVTDWYRKQFAAKSVNATQTASGFSGKSEDGDDFTITLTPGAAGQTKGAIDVVDAK
jgi:N-acetylmuramoyl-L-alanine amidase